MGQRDYMHREAAYYIAWDSSVVCKPVRIRLNSKAYKLALCGCTDRGSSAVQKGLPSL